MGGNDQNFQVSVSEMLSTNKKRNSNTTTQLKPTNDKSKLVTLVPTIRTTTKCVAEQKRKPRGSADEKIVSKDTTKKNKKSGRARKLRIDGDTTETDEECIREKCNFNHTDYETNYGAESDKRYFSKNGALGSVKCRICFIVIGDERRDDVCVPSRGSPVYVCLGRNHFKCIQAICGHCYKEEVMKGTNKRRRKTRRVAA